MSEAQNTQVVKDAYAACGRGDVNGILVRADEGGAVGEFWAFGSSEGQSCPA